MTILLDECVDWRLLRDLPGHDVKSVKQMGWSETVNGALLALARSIVKFTSWIVEITLFLVKITSDLVKTTLLLVDFT